MKPYSSDRPVITVTVEDAEPGFVMEDNFDSMAGAPNERRPLLVRGVSALSVMGTVRLTNGEIVFVPPATADPRDPLNMKPWQKTLVVVIVCSFSAISMSMIGGFGGIISFYVPKYIAQGETYPNITHLMTYPSLFMGLGNLIGMPIAIAVGRRVVLLTATIVLIIGAVMCAMSNSLSVHFAGRMLIGLACGQGESLVPLIIQEIHFLHERTRVLMIQQTIQVIFSAVWQLCASPIAEAISPSWWYGLGAGIATIQFCTSIVLLPETKYTREYTNTGLDGSSIEPSTKRPPLDLIKYKARTWQSDMRLWIGSPEWHKAGEVLEHVLQLLLFPNVIWVVCLCGFSLGINISMATTYGEILQRDPYNWPNKFISYANFGQLPVAIFCFPLLGYAADKLTQWRARCNHGLHEPENRLLLLPVPVSIGIISAIAYGQGASQPWNFHWITYPLGLAGYFLGFVGTNVILITYLLDSYPTRAGPILITVGAIRGMLSCLVSFNVAKFIERFGYDSTFAAFGFISTCLAVVGIPMFFFGKRIRVFTSHWTRSSKTDSRSV